ncbi:nitrile hydratase [Hyaloraphidium curvatum]|nr:nitrile hydratase [Hyaloraphidium curvatum]
MAASQPPSIGAGGIHDYGGQDFSALPRPDMAGHDLAPWEKQVDALVACLRAKNLLTVDMLRRGIEGHEGEMYRSWPYYGLWASSIAKILLERGALSQRDLDAQLGPADSTERILYSPGETVRVKPEGTRSRWRKPHLRVPGYIYGACGVVERVCGVFKDPERLAFDAGAEEVQPLYRVRFALGELWPEYKKGSKDTVDVEIYQSWLEKPGEGEAEASTRAGHEVSHDHGAHDHGGHSHDHGGHGHDHGAHDHGGHSHDGDEEGVIDHGDHQHLPRVQIERVAVEREGEPSVPQRFAEALIAACLETGVVDREALRTAVERVDMAGAKGEGGRIVAKAWTDPEFKARLIKDASSAVAELGLSASNTTAPTVLTAVEDTDSVKNVIVCTLCSCYPRSILGIPPDWYKSRSYRTRVVRDPRGTLADWFGMEFSGDVEIRVHDSTADLRYIVIPKRPEGTEGWTEEQLAAIVTRDAMVGCAPVKVPAK